MKINWLNYKLLKIDGYGRLGLSCIKNLIRLGIDVRPDTIDCLEHPTWLQQAQGLDFSRATVCLMPSYHLKPIPGRIFNFTMWESTKLDWERWQGVNKLAHVMIVPSTWLVEMMRDQGVKIPIEVAGCSVDTDECQLLTKKVDGTKPYTFMAWGDRSPRKGDDIVWSAFYRAFGASKDVRLIIKCRGEAYSNFDISNSDRRVSIWNADVDNVTDIYAHADCFVFPTRGEGLGMPCFPPGAKVTMRNGTKNIEDILVGDEVLTHTGSTRIVTETMAHKVSNETVVHIGVVGSNQDILLTHNHRLLSFKRNDKRYSNIKNVPIEPTWNYASELKEDDFVFIPKKKFDLNSLTYIDLGKFTEVSGNKLTSKYSNHGRNAVTARDISIRSGINVSAVRHTLNSELSHVNLASVEKIVDAANELGRNPIYYPSRYMPLNEDTGFLFGQYTAEGSCGDSGTIEFASHKKEHDIRSRLSRALKDTWELPSHESVDDGDTNKARLTTGCLPLSKVLKNTCGKGAYNKKIPEFIYGNVDFAKGYLIGLWLGDGTFSSEYSYSTVSETLARQLRTLLSSFGVISSLNKSKRGDWILRVSGHSEKVFLSIFNKNIKDKVFRSPYIEVENGWLAPIRSISSELYSGVVYNLEVQDDHSYCVENVATHNCREAAACGVPTIATNWSGTADDIANWAWPLNNYKLTPSLLDGGGLWATPNVDEVVELMLWMFNNRELAIKQAREKALWIRTNRSYEYTAKNLINIINKWT